ncbi:ATP-binding protein [Butyrivibrio fibrisolvens]|uniref:ATP-binding protein n=1 Tax=Butyrivibrio fibrisolvens TaxID=831 RepID=UPI0004193569|nr:ATP-binding protein [Butyrivibrio fibrisolvens]
MKKVTEIEKAIIDLSPGDFQKFCDSFLSKKGTYGVVTGLGMKSGSNKTTIGNPDTYFRKENGKYVFVVYTHQQKNIFRKLKDDISKCFDEGKTKLPIADIEEIICCHTSSNLKPGDDKALHDYCAEKGVKLSILGVDEIAQQVCNLYPSLATEIGVSIDTNQVLTVDEFVEVYDANEMVAPLNTIFYGRTEELHTLNEKIKDEKVVIVHGPAGTGKTRTVLEAIRKYRENHDCEVLCIKNNNLPIYEDITLRTEKPGDYLFFIDDANELAGLPNIVQYISKPEYNVKVIMTVRDYAKNGVTRIVRNYTDPELFLMRSFSDEDISSFLKINLGITNFAFVDQIIRLAEGNPRIAYMAGKIALDTQSIKAIHDASGVYESYYEPILDSRIGEDRKLRLSLGIVSFVNTVFLDKIELLNNLLEIVDITAQEFKENIYRLSELEILEIHMDSVVAITDQCLANYMLFYSVYRKKEISLSGLLDIGFKFSKGSTIRAINTLLNIFSSREMRDFVASEVGKVWDKYKKQEDIKFYEFVKFFHIFRPEEAFLIANEKIDEISQEDVEDIRIDFEKKSGYRIRNDNVLEMLSGYKYTTYIGTAIELLLKYVEKSEECALEAYKYWKCEFDIDQDSIKYNFWGENQICNALRKYDGSNLYVKRFMIAVIKRYLAFDFRPAAVGHDNNFKLYHIELENCEKVKSYRQMCWELLITLSGFHELKSEIEDVLRQYASLVRGANDRQVVEDDKVFVEKLADSLNMTELRKAIIRRNLEHGWEKIGIPYIHEGAIFSHEIWHVYSILGDGFIYSGLDYKEYLKSKEKDIEEFASGLSIEDIDKLIPLTNQIIKEAKFGWGRDEDYTIISNFEKIVNHVGNDPAIAERIFVKIMDLDAFIGFCPVNLFKTLFNNMPSKDLYSMIRSREFRDKNKWQYHYFDTIPENLVDNDVYMLLIDYITDKSDKDITTSNYRNLRFLDKFLHIDNSAYVNISKRIFEKTDYNGFIVQIYFSLLFHKDVFAPEEVWNLFRNDLELLRNIYFYMISLNDIADLQGEFLVEFLNRDESWLHRYAEYVVKMLIDGDEHEHYTFQALWNTEKYMHYYDEIYKCILKHKDALCSWQLSQGFKSLLSHEQGQTLIQQRQDEWIIHTVKLYAKSEDVVILFKAIYDLDPVIRKQALIEFVRVNDDYELFEKIPLDSDDWGGSVDSIIPQLEGRIEYLKSLLPEFTGVKYLKHSNRVRNRIEMWKETIRQEEIESITRRFYY